MGLRSFANPLAVRLVKQIIEGFGNPFCGYYVCVPTVNTIDWTEKYVLIFNCGRGFFGNVTWRKRHKMLYDYISNKLGVVYQNFAIKVSYRALYEPSLAENLVLVLRTLPDTVTFVSVGRVRK